MCRAGYPEPRTKTMYRCVDAAAITLVHTPMPPAVRSGAAGGGAADAAATSGLIRLLPWRLVPARQLTASWLSAGGSNGLLPGPQPTRPREGLRTPNRMMCGNSDDHVMVESAVRKGQQSPWIVPDELWARIEPLLPVVPRRADHPCRRRLDDREVLCGILFVLYTGSRGSSCRRNWVRVGDDLLAAAAGLA